jgi:hypothetical protein
MKTLLLTLCCFSFLQSGISQLKSSANQVSLRVQKTSIITSESLTIKGDDLVIFQYFHQGRSGNEVQLHDKECGESLIHVNNHILSIDLCEYHLSINSHYMELEPTKSNNIPSITADYSTTPEMIYRVLFSSKKEYSIINSKSIVHRYFIDAGDLSIVPHKTFCGETGSCMILVVYGQSKIEFTSLYDVTVIEMDSDNDGIKELFIIEDKGCADVLSVYQISKKQLDRG